MKNVSVSFDVDEQTANYLKHFIRDYKRFSKSKQAFILEIMKDFLISWDPDVTDDIPDEHVQQLIKLTRSAYLLLMLKCESSNFKFKVLEGKNNV